MAEVPVNRISSLRGGEESMTTLGTGRYTYTTIEDWARQGPLR